MYIDMSMYYQGKKFAPIVFRPIPLKFLVRPYLISLNYTDQQKKLISKPIPNVIEYWTGMVCGTQWCLKIFKRCYSWSIIIC